MFEWKFWDVGITVIIYTIDLTRVSNGENDFISCYVAVAIAACKRVKQ